VREDIERVSGNSIGEVRDNGNAVLYIGSLIRRSINRRGGVRKSRDRVRM
jgi:hypothetical protein